MLTGSGERGERPRYTRQVHERSDELVGTGYSSTKTFQGRGEFVTRVAEREPKFNLFGYGGEGLDRVFVHADADHDDATSRWGVAD